jgi:hypothetical protein
MVNYIMKCGRELYVNFKVWFIGLDTTRYGELVDATIPVMMDMEDSMRDVEERLEKVSDQMMCMEDCLEVDMSLNTWVNEEDMKKQRKMIAKGRRDDFERGLEAKLRMKHWNPDANRMNENAINHTARLICEQYNLGDKDTFASVMRVVPRVLVPDQVMMDALSIIYNTRAQQRRMRSDALRKTEALPYFNMK